MTLATDLLMLLSECATDEVAVPVTVDALVLVALIPADEDADADADSVPVVAVLAALLTSVCGTICRSSYFMALRRSLALS